VLVHLTPPVSVAVATTDATPFGAGCNRAR
jgi:hypothetical protein